MAAVDWIDEVLDFAIEKEAEMDEMESLFEWLANEEAKHKLRFEVEYDDFVMRED